MRCRRTRHGRISSASVVDDSPGPRRVGAPGRAGARADAGDAYVHGPPGRLDLSALRERERALDKIKVLERRTSTKRGDAVSDAESRGGIAVGLD